MERVKTLNNLETVPRPCEWFDMMAGSNTGGCVTNVFQTLVLLADYPNELRIIALLLGRLRMSVDEAIVAYMSLCEQVFSDTRWISAQQYKTSKLEAALKEIVRAKTGSSETRMMIRSDCKV